MTSTERAKLFNTVVEFDRRESKNALGLYCIAIQNCEDDSSREGRMTIKEAINRNFLGVLRESCLKAVG